MNTSREKFLAQLERCVARQKTDIIPPNVPISAEESIPYSEFIPEEPMGNGALVDTESSSTWGLRPPNDHTETFTGDWA